MRRKKWLIVSLVGILTISAALDSLFYLRGIPSSPAGATLAGALSVLLLVMWIDADRADHPQVARFFDFGFLVLTFWLPYLPYYLWRTRGAAGLFMFAGFIGLFSMGFLVQLL